uniref:Uncharacterized protein n=1 Tax=Anopheles coluzzii TaxID=1518534 RepID=A0A8W7PPP6_ANOCL
MKGSRTRFAFNSKGFQQLLHWRCGVRDAEERFDGFEKFVSVQRQHQPLQTAVPRLHDPVAEARIFVQIHRGTVQDAHQQKINDAKWETFCQQQTTDKMRPTALCLATDNNTPAHPGQHFPNRPREAELVPMCKRPPIAILNGAASMVDDDTLPTTASPLGGGFTTSAKVAPLLYHCRHDRYLGIDDFR